MQRRSFLRNISLGAIAVGFVPHYGMAHFLPPSRGTLVNLGAPMTQIRHGALHVPTPPAIPFDWLQQVHRNIFFKNGFQRSQQSDLEIVSVLLQGGEQTEAVQIQLAAEGSTLMIGEEMVFVGREEGFQQVGKEAVGVQFYLADFEAGKEYVFSPETEATVYVQLLEGHLNCNEQHLDIQTGLALAEAENLHFYPTEDSRILLLIKKE